MNSSEQWIRLAQILRPQGRKGEVLADLYTEFPEQFDTAGSVGLAPDGFAERSANGALESQPQPIEIVAHWLPVGRNAGRIVLQFAGVSSIEQAEALAGKEVVIRASERRELDDGSVYVADLVGARVLDGDTPVGVITEVLFPATSDGARKLEEAAPLLSVTSSEGDEILIPFASAYVVSVDLPNRLLRMNLPEGLVDVNRASRAEADTE